MAYHFIALDIDGTLANSRKEISYANIDALDQAQEAGVKVALVSGRPTYGILPTAQKIHLDRYGGYIFAFNGALVTNAANGEVLYENALPHEVLPLIQAASHEFGVGMITYRPDCVLTETPDDPYIVLEAGINHMPIKGVDDIVKATKEPTPKSLLVGEPGYLADVEAVLKERFPKLNVYRSEPYFLELVPQFVDKAYALDRMLRQLGMTSDQLMACGDGFNDTSMVRYAGLGVAVSNAQEEVKRVATYISPYSNDEDAVAHAVRKFILNDA